jgi:hypothetical protein
MYGRMEQATFNLDELDPEAPNLDNGAGHQA